MHPLLHYLKYGRKGNLSQCSSLKISKENFQDFTFSKLSHWEYFAGLDLELYGKDVDKNNCTLKKYQDLLVLKFIYDHVPPSSRILDVGGGVSRILLHLTATYDCWNIDKMEGMGNGPVAIKNNKFRLVKDYMGNFNPELPGEYFDFVFSISALEHTPEDQQTFDDIIKDIDRVLKPNSYSLHLFDVLLKGDRKMWTNKFVHRIFDTLDTVNLFVKPEKIFNDPDLYFMSEEAYNRSWKHITKRDFQEFGRPVSLNILWQKPQ